jgi:hypothetical protein
MGSLLGNFLILFMVQHYDRSLNSLQPRLDEKLKNSLNVDMVASAAI